MPPCGRLVSLSPRGLVTCLPLLGTFTGFVDLVVDLTLLFANLLQSHKCARVLFWERSWHMFQNRGRNTRSLGTTWDSSISMDTSPDLRLGTDTCCCGGSSRDVGPWWVSSPVTLDPASCVPSGELLELPSSAGIGSSGGDYPTGLLS